MYVRTSQLFKILQNKTIFQVKIAIVSGKIVSLAVGIIVEFIIHLALSLVLLRGYVMDTVCETNDRLLCRGLVGQKVQVFSCKLGN